MGLLNNARLRLPCIQLDNPNEIRIREQHTFELDYPYLFKHDSDKFTEPTTNRPGESKMNLQNPKMGGSKQTERDQDIIIVPSQIRIQAKQPMYRERERERDLK